MFGLGTPELVVILLVVVLFFGPKKIPDLAKSLGQSIRAFKKGKDGENKEIEDRSDHENKNS